MELELELVCPEPHLSGDNIRHVFDGRGGVIGRAPDSDWVLPDPSRHLSGRHALISFEAGQFFITDVSTNGTCLNGTVPLTRQVAVALHDGDELRMGSLPCRVRLRSEPPRMDYPPAEPPLPEPAATGIDPALHAFAEGLGLPAKVLAGGLDATFMGDAGRLLRLCLQGVIDNAQARASQKNQFRLDMTLMSPRNNNPVKLAADVDHLLRLLLARDPSYLPVAEGVAECLADVRQHQDALVAGMQTVFTTLMQQMDPVERVADVDQVNTGWLGFLRRDARYWNAYCDWYQTLREEGDLAAGSFADQFARAYEQHVLWLKQGVTA